MFENRRSRIFLALCLTAGTLASALSCTAQSTKHSTLIPALKLTQTHFYFGDTETIVSMKGVRINNHGRMKFVLVAKSPDWVVNVFRTDCFSH